MIRPTVGAVWCRWRDAEGEWRNEWVSEREARRRERAARSAEPGGTLWTARPGNRREGPIERDDQGKVGWRNGTDRGTGLEAWCRQEPLRPAPDTVFHEEHQEKVGKEGREKLIGGQTLAPEVPAKAAGAALCDGMARWLRAHEPTPGAWPYEWDPVKRTDSLEDLSVRRLLGVLGLARAAHARDRPEWREDARRALHHCLRRYYRPLDTRRGAVVEERGAAIGPTGIAVAAILACHEEQAYHAELSGLLGAIHGSLDPHQGYRAGICGWYGARDWDFFAGEALMGEVIATRAGVRGARTGEALARTYRQCLDHHRRRRARPFAPWGIQAGAELYRMGSERWVWEAVRELAEWSWEHQESDVADPRMRGRILPGALASGTGVNMESLVEAVECARRARVPGWEQEAARRLRAGLRHLRQLQVRDWREAPYAADPESEVGAIRNDCFDARVRIDNLGHTLSAAARAVEYAID